MPNPTITVSVGKLFQTVLARGRGHSPRVLILPFPGKVMPYVRIRQCQARQSVSNILDKRAGPSLRVELCQSKYIRCEESHTETVHSSRSWLTGENSAVPTPTCTCNDNQGHNLITKTFAGAVRTFCPDAPPPGLPQDGTCSYPLPVCRPKNVRKCSNPLPVCAGAPKSSAQVPVGAPPTAVAPTTAVPKASDIGLPTTDPMCYNSPPPPPHNDPNRDQVIKLCGIKDDDLARVCKSNWHPKDPASSPNGPGIAPMDCHPDPGAAQIDPVNSNVYKAKFVLAENTQPDCGFIFGNNATDDATLERVPPLCVPAFSAIRDKCPWSGGEVKNGCGTFYYWSCPKENQGCLPGQG